MAVANHKITTEITKTHTKTLSDCCYTKIPIKTVNNRNGVETFKESLNKTVLAVTKVKLLQLLSIATNKNTTTVYFSFQDWLHSFILLEKILPLGTSRHQRPAFTISKTT